MPRFLSCVVVSASALQLAACSDGDYPLAPVHGTVLTCEGKPAAGGWIEFSPLDEPERTKRPAGFAGRVSRGQIADDGTFTLDTTGPDIEPGAVVGRHHVSFEMPLTKPAALADYEKANMTEEDIKEAEQRFAKMPVYPAIRCSVIPAPRQVEVKPGGNRFEFKLEPGKPTRGAPPPVL